VKFNFNARYTDIAQEADPSIQAVFTDEAGEYIVERWELPLKAGSFESRLAIKRTDRQPIRSWRVLQDIKNEIAGRERIAVEIYPAESRVIDTANIYHLWVFEEGYGPVVSLGPPVKAN
jgi:hypothetical protein